AAAERFALGVAAAAAVGGLEAVAVNMVDLKVDVLGLARRVLLVAAGGAQDGASGRMARAWHELMGEGAPRLDGVEYGMVDLDREPAAKAAPAPGSGLQPSLGEALDDRFSMLGAKRLSVHADDDVDAGGQAAALIRAFSSETEARSR